MTLYQGFLPTTPANDLVYQNFNESEAKTLSKAIEEARDSLYREMLLQVANFVDPNTTICNSSYGLLLLKDPTVTYRGVTKTAFTVAGIQFWDVKPSCFDMIRFTSQGKRYGTYVYCPTFSDQVVHDLVDHLIGWVSIGIGAYIRVK